MQHEGNKNMRSPVRSDRLEPHGGVGVIGTKRHHPTEAADSCIDSAGIAMNDVLSKRRVRACEMPHVRAVEALGGNISASTKDHDN